LESILQLQPVGTFMATVAVEAKDTVMAEIAIKEAMGIEVTAITGTVIMATVADMVDIVAIIMAGIITAIMEVMGIAIIITAVMGITIIGMIMDGKLLPLAWEQLLLEALS
jgi:hypothetical protein